MMSHLLQLAESYKPLALYSGASIVLLGTAYAVRVLFRVSTTQPKGNQA